MRKNNIKRLVWVLLTMCLVAVALPGTVFADTGTVNGITYEFTPGGGTEATVTGYDSGLSGAITIPGTVEIGGSTYTVTAIGNGAFFGCTGITSVNIPSSVIFIGTRPFEGCTSLEAIHVDSNNPHYSSEGGVLFGWGSTLIAYPAKKPDTSYTIPDSVETIEDHAFEKCSSLKTIIFEGSAPQNGYTESFHNLPSNLVIYYPANQPADYENPLWRSGFGLGGTIFKPIHLWIGGVPMTAQFLAEGGAAAQDTQPTSGRYAEWKEPSGTGGVATLTLHNMTAEGKTEDNPEPHESAAVYYCGAAPIIIKLEGTNTLTAGAAPSGWSAAIYVDSNEKLIIRGSGTLEASSEKHHANAYGHAGIFRFSGDIEIESSATVRTEVENADTYNAGICIFTSGDLKIFGTVSAVCGTKEKGANYGFYVDYDSSTPGGNIHILSGATVEVDVTANESPVGIRAKNNIVIGSTAYVSVKATSEDPNWPPKVMSTVPDGGVNIEDGDYWIEIIKGGQKSFHHGNSFDSGPYEWRDTTYFQMPATPVYTVTYTDGVGGTVFADDVHVDVNRDAPTPSFTPPTRPGYTFTGWSPAVAATVTQDVTYTAQWQPDKYTVTVTATEGGTASASANEAAQGTDVTLTAAADSGYSFVRWETVGGGTDPDDPAGKTTSFVMPANAVAFRAVFEKDPLALHNVTVACGGEGSGSALAAPDHAAAGTQVTLTAAAADGSKFVGWTVTGGSITLADASAASTTFTMPAEDVTVTAVFALQQEETKVPKTGDNSNIDLWAGLMMSALAGLAVCFTAWRRARTH